MTKRPSLQPVVSVVVPAYNASRTIGLCVEALLNQDYPKDHYDIIVVDNRSTDDTREIVRRYPVRLLEERDRQSSYAARNRGLRAACGELIAFTDSDCIPDRQWLRQLVEGDEDLSHGGFAGRVVPYEPTTLLERFAVERHQVSQDISMANSYLPIAITANVAYRKDVLETLGGFNDTMISSGDANLAWRLQLLYGKTIRFNRAAVVYHKHRSTFRSFWRQHRIYGFGTAMLCDQFPGYAKSLGYETRYWLWRVSWFLARGLARLLQYPVKSNAGALYFAEHFLEILCTTSRFIGIIQYHWQRPSLANSLGFGLPATLPSPETGGVPAGTRGSSGQGSEPCRP
jgi:cellulose synthase/poly-beta-1,6-N-acetylglucosamine synthase-like glycosyltransferase